MNWNRCSRTLLSLLFPVPTAAPAAAISADAPNAPDRQGVGEERPVTVAPHEPAEAGPGGLTLRGGTRFAADTRTGRSATQNGTAGPGTFGGRSLTTGVPAATDGDRAEASRRSGSRPWPGDSPG